MNKLKVRWIDHGRKPTQKSNPLYPKGIDLDLSKGADMCCAQALPYPAKRCGMFMVTCELCGLKVAISTAGRPDDPRSVKLACKPLLHGGKNAKPS